MPSFPITVKPSADGLQDTAKYNVSCQETSTVVQMSLDYVAVHSCEKCPWIRNYSAFSADGSLSSCWRHIFPDDAGWSKSK